MKDQTLTPQQIIAMLQLTPMPIEGGWFRQTYIAAESIAAAALPARYGSPRAFGTAIYYLLTADADSFSALHRLASDEIYHFYLGDPVDLLLLCPDGTSQKVTLGPDLAAGQQVQWVVPREVWQGSRLAPGGSYALLGTTMAPAFDLRDFTLGERGSLTRQYPQQAELIRLLTREPRG